MKRLLLFGSISFLCLLVGALLSYKLYLEEKEVGEANAVREVEIRHQQSERQLLLSSIVEMSDVDKYPDPEKRIEGLEVLRPMVGDQDDPKVPSYIRDQFELALAIAYYEAAEDRLYRAQTLAVAYSFNQSDMNPLVMENYLTAVEDYKMAKERIDGIKEIEGNNDFNFSLQYARGNIYFRVLSVIASNDEKREFFEQTALAWERALDFKEKDQDTQINLEILKQNQSNLLSGSTGNNVQKLKQIPKLTKPRYSIGSQPGKI